MHAVAKKSVAVASAVGLAGVSSLFFGAAPASAIPTCANGGVELTGTHICELTLNYNSGDASPGDFTFQATSDMSQLQVLLVGGGGEGGYGSGGGGGGSVKIVDFDGGSSPLMNIHVGNELSDTTLAVGSTTVTAAHGLSDEAPTTTTVKGKTVPVNGKSGASGNGHAGYHEGSSEYGGGGGADGSPMHHRDGGAGKIADKVTVKTIKAKDLTPIFKLFAGDTTCYGGGGAVGDGTNDGVPGCSSAGHVLTGGTLDGAVDGYGGGSGAVISATPGDGNTAASGVVVIRWNATVPVTLSFNDGKRGHNPKTEHLLAGDTPTKPSNPKVSGYSFLGWYTDSSFTTAADFTQPVTDFETFYGKFKKK